MNKVSFLDRLASNGTLATAAAVALPIATTAAIGAVELAGMSLAQTGPQGLLSVPYGMWMYADQFVELATKVMPEMLATGAAGTVVLSSIEKLTGRQMINFSLKEIASRVLGKPGCTDKAPQRIQGCPSLKDQPQVMQPTRRHLDNARSVAVGKGLDYRPGLDLDSFDR